MLEPLASIAKRVAPKKQYLKAFIARYETLFNPLRHKPITLLELGVGGYKNPTAGGGSLKMWADFFPNASIIGIDINEKNLDLPANVTVRCGSQTDPDFLDGLANEYGGFDIIIDDASHVTAKTVASFEILWSFVRHFYVVEDLHMMKAKGTADYFEKVSGADLDTLNMCVITKGI